MSRYMLWNLDAVLTKVSLLCQSIFHSSLKISLASIVACVVVHILEFEVGVLYVADVWLWFMGLKSSGRAPPMFLLQTYLQWLSYELRKGCDIK